MGGEDGCWWELGHLFCVPEVRWRKTKEQKPWNNTKHRFSLNRKKGVFCFTSSVSSAQNFWLEFAIHQYLDKFSIHLVRESVHFIGSYMNYWPTFDCQTGNLTSSCMLRTEKPITFKMTGMWTFPTNFLLHGYLVLMYVHKQLWTLS